MKRLIAIFIMLCLLLGMSSVSAWAASIGQPLKNPESGWQRIDGDDHRITYTPERSKYSAGSGNQFYWNNSLTACGKDGYVKFKFYGTKLRIINNLFSKSSPNIGIIIDGKEEVFSEYTSSSSQVYLAMVYEKLDLPLGVHSVYIYSKHKEHGVSVDAIDIDDTGYLVDITELKLSVLLNTGENVQLSTSFDLNNNKNLTWTSTNESVATVDSNGKVTAVGAGDADIYAESANGTFKEYIPVKVVEGIADELRLAVHLKAGEKAKLYLTDDPSQVTWSSMDESTVTVSADGQVTGIKKGLAIVQAELDGQTYQIYVRVNG